ncbi:MAG: hypothetical protein VX517_01000 [Candidatus Neomarinimicrobiota bacterium]|nr:hypothetical protein [Candidatus Neomarinimicrobiota bacterium]
MIKNLLFLSLTTIIFGQNNRVENIDISTKKNGVSIKILANFSIQPSQITGWYNQSNSWYYITIYNAFGDTVSLGKTKTNYPITDIEAIKIGESIQLGFKMSQPVENFEFYHNNTQELLIALRFPLSNVLASMEEDRPVVSMQTSQTNSVSKAFYLLGSSIIGLEILKSKSNES